MAESVAQKKLDPFSILFQRAWERYRQEFNILLPIAVLANAGQMYSALVSAFLPNDVGTLIVHVLVVLASVVLGVWAGLALYAKVAHPAIASVSEAFTTGGPYFWDALVTGLLVGLTVLGGFILFFFPGVYWAIVFGFAVFIVYRENLSGTAAMRRSKELVTGHWWEIWWREFLVGLCYFLVILAMIPLLFFNKHLQELLQIIVITVLSPLPLLFQAALYDNLVALKGPAAKSEK